MSAHVNVAARLAALPPEKRTRLKAILNRVTTPSIDSAAQSRELGRKPGNDNGMSLSFAQTRLWFLHRYQPDSAVYNVPRAFRLTARLDVSALSAAFAEIVRRHATLRTGFAMVGPEARQAVHAEAAFKLDIVDLSHLAEAQRETEAQHLLDQEAARPFDLAHPPLLRATLIALGEDEHALLINLHHIVADGWSLEVLGRELAALYRAYRDGRPTPLPELPIQYADYTRWQREWLSGEVLSAQLGYWKQKLKDAPPLIALPTDRPRPQTQSFHGAQHVCTLDRWLLEDLKALNQKSGTTLFISLLAAFAVLLARYGRSDDIVIGSPIAGRTRAETENLIGCFVNTLALRIDLSGDPSFADLLGRVRETALEAYAYQDLPFEKLVEELKPERSLSHSPLFQVAFVLQNSACPLALDSLAVERIEIGVESAKFDLNLAAVETGQGLQLRFEYSTDLFDAATIARMAGHFEVLLTGIVADPQQKIAALPLLHDSERQTLLHTWNRTETAYPKSQTIAALFAQQAALTPHNTALLCEDQRISYAELNQRANRLAHHLIALGAAPQILIGVCMERSVDAIVALLAILKTGAAYLPLDPNYPRDRLAFMLEDAQALILLVQPHLIERLPEHRAKVVLIDEMGTDAGSAAWARCPADDPSPAVGPDHLAYVMYTSGSTGTPKGVMAPHRGVVRLVRNTAYADFGADQVFLQFAPISFDASTFEIWGALLNGAALAIFAPHTPSLDEIAQALVKYEVTALWLTASLFHLMVDHQLAALLKLRQLLAGGDVLSVAHVEKFLKGGGKCRLINGYGPTESTTFTCCYSIPRERTFTSVPIGRPIANTRVYILDSRLQPVPQGVAGELYVGGDGLALGYLNRPDLSTERFIACPFSEKPGGQDVRLYKTGDLVRYRADGNIEFLGRMDSQVKIRGFRIEPGEIEAVLGAHPGVREIAVIAREDARGDKRLVAYVVGQTQPPPGHVELRSYLQGRLPEYMMPAAFVVLDGLPITENGKLDRRALPAPDETHIARASWAAPETPTEVAVAQVFGDLLKVERPGRDDNFFDLGGHSLLATQLIVRLRAAFQFELPLQALFDAPTVAELSKIISASAGVGEAARQTIAKMETGAETTRAPLSFAQARLWFLHQYEPDSAFYNLPRALMLKGEVSVDALAAAFDSLVARHEALRTVFTTVNDEPIQVIKPAAEFKLERIDLRIDLAHLPESARRAEALRLAQDDAMQPFDLAHGPLLRMSLITIASDEHLLVINLHHIVFDGWSTAVFNREFSALYESHKEGVPPRLAALPIQYADYARWQLAHLQGRLLETELTYWKGQLAGAPPLLELPTDHPRPPSQSFKGAAVLHQVDNAVLDRIKVVGQRNQATLFMTLSAAFSVLLSRYARCDDIVFGSVIAGRTRIETENLIGFFVNTLVLRIDCANDPSFEELLGRVREIALDAYAHQDVPFERLFEELKPERNPAYSPLIQVLFVLQNNTVEPLHLKGATVERIESQQKTAKFDLSLAATETGQGLQLNFEYSTDLFDAATIARMAGHFSMLLSAIADDPKARLSRLPLLTAPEQRQLLRDWNQTEVDFPQHANIAALFEEQVELHPHAEAIVFPADSARPQRALSYDQLNRRANRLAHHLIALGVVSDDLVGLCVERSPEMIVALLAILKAGGAYLPLDPNYPQERLAFMLEDAAVKVVISAAHLAHTLAVLPRDQAKTVLLDQEQTYAAYPETNPAIGTTLDHLAYVIYTSGSTGKPKGVMITQRALLNYVHSASRDYNIRPGDRVLQFASINFDASAEEIYCTLGRGATLVLRTDSMLDSPERFFKTCAAWGLTHLSLPTAYWHDLAAAAAALVFPNTLRTVVIGGERALAERVVLWQRHAPNSIKLMNSYGPTETTIAATLWPVSSSIPSLEKDGSRATPIAGVPIGRPIANTEIYILDAARNPVPIGVAGELYIGGAGLARGYLNRAELTREKFVPHPFKQESGARLYRTGDLARYLADGNIEFLGRIDQQVKIRGFRVELGEIEAALNQHGKVHQAVVIAHQNGADARLIAYVVARESELAPSHAELRAHLKGSLPDYMLPSAFVVLDALPLNPSGKLDRKALPIPDQARPPLDAAFAAPRTPYEETLAQIWAAVLKLRKIGIHDNFFELGGHSLLATQVISRTREAFQIDLPLRALFEAPTVAGLVLKITGSQLQQAPVDELTRLLGELEGPLPAQAEAGV